MKKLSKILATALAMALAMSAVVMPITAEAASTADAPGKEFLFNTVDEIEVHMDTTGLPNAVEFGVGGRMDNVAAFHRGNGRGMGAWGSVWATDVFTVEFMVYNPNGIGFGVYPTDMGSDPTVSNRYGMGLTGAGVVEFRYGASTPTKEQAGTYNKNVWNKFAYTLDVASDTMTIYLNGAVLAVKNDCGLMTGGFHKDIRVTTDSTTTPVYIDSLRAYEAAYDPSRDIAPADVTPEGLINGKFLTTSSLSDVKAALAVGQDLDKVVVQVYTDYIGGTVATKLTKGCIAAVHSKSGDIVKGYLVDDPVTVNSVTLADGVLTGVVANYGTSAVPSMTMILVEDGGKLVYSSETITNITTSATFTIEGLGSSLSNPEVFFVKDWTNPYAVLDEIYDVE